MGDRYFELRKLSRIFSLAHKLSVLYMRSKNHYEALQSEMQEFADVKRAENDSNSAIEIPAELLNDFDEISATLADYKKDQFANTTFEVKEKLPWFVRGIFFNDLFITYSEITLVGLIALIFTIIFSI